MTIEPIAFFSSPFTSKFGIPRQSGIVGELRGKVVFAPPYQQGEALRGLEDYDYVWLIWGFSANVDALKRPTVRPPLLGGNERMGVWATRSSFRPNNLALSSVRIVDIDVATPAIEVAGADLMDGTPIYDVKPYLPYADSHPGARGGFTDHRAWRALQVDIPPQAAALLSAGDLSTLEKILAQDPRPQYHHDDSREYGMPFMGWDVRFRVSGHRLEVTRIVKK